MRRKQYIITNIFLVYSLLICGQSEDIKGIAPNFMSPQVADIIRHDHTPVSLNSGRVDLNIPVLNNFFDRDFTFPISLSYNSAGFKPSEPEGNVGLHWSLMMGGVIYREVRGIPDDFDEMVYRGIGADLTVKGFLRLAKGSTTKATSQLLFEKPNDFIDHNYNYNIALLKGSNNIEASSDIYRFNFGEHSGKFVIDFDGSVKSIGYSGGKVQVDISKYLLSKNVQDSNSGKSEIRITTDDGYTYCFGGSYSAMEYTAFTWDEKLTYRPPGASPTNPNPVNPISQNQNDLLRHNTISAFYLHQIIAPNGRKLKINYKNLVDKLVNNKNYHVLPWDLFNFSIEDDNEDLQMCYLLRQSKYATAPSLSFELLSLNKIALVESVELDDKIIKFYHSHKKNTIYDIPTYRKDFVFGRKTGAKLDSVCLYLKDNNKLLKIESTSFKYEQIGRREFLSQINNAIKGKYNFAYNSEGTDVSPLTIDYDHWGYWNGSGTNKSLIVIYDFQENWKNFENGNRRPGVNVHNATLLDKITYPTGGYTKFIYEQHECRYSLEIPLLQTSEEYPQMTPHSKNLKIGGSRIKQIEYNSNQGQKWTKDYIYSISPIENDDLYSSSGELLYVPVYVFPTKNLIFPLISYSSYGFNERPYDTDHVRYKSVLEYSSPTRKYLSVPNENLSISIAPSDKIRKKVLKINTKNVSQNWIISGFGKGQFYSQDGTARISVYDPKSSRIPQSFYFYGNIYGLGYTGDPVYGESREDKVLRLAPNTDYTIELECHGPADMQNGAYVSVDITYNTGYEYDVVEPDQCKQTIFSYYGTGSTIKHGNPDDYNNDKLYYNDILVNGKPSSPIEDKILDNLCKSITKKSQDRSIERGRIEEEKYFSKDGDLVKSIIYEYRPAEQDLLTNYTTYINTPPSPKGTRLGYYSQINKEYFYSYNLVTKVMTDKFSDDIISKENYKYDQQGYYLKEKSIFNSEMGEVKLTYNYPFSYTNEVYKYMVSSNLISPVIEKITSVNNKEIARVKNSYSYVIKGRPSPNEPYMNFFPTKVETSTTGTSGLKAEVTYDLYDSLGNLLQKTNKDGVVTSYLWSYNGQYPVVEVVNATYDQVKTVLGVTPESISSTLSPDMTKINLLREKLPEAQVITYQYKPLVGMTEKTDPRGVTTYYDYDSFGRLKETYIKENGQKRIIESYNYHYQNQ